MSTVAVRAMFRSHPERPPHAETMSRCIDACFSCVETCTACADACLGEDNVASLVRCIRLNLDCADVCETTGRLLSRRTEAEIGVLRAQVEACAEACAACGAECERHAKHHEHCRVCAEACRRCEEACRQVLSSVAA